MSDDAELAMRRKLNVTQGLGLFDAMGRPPVPPVPTIHLPGAGQLARSEARERAKAGSEAAYRKLAMALEGHGPSTRKELAELTGLKRDTVNGRISEMRARTDDLRVHTEGRRGGESICHLSRLSR